MLYGSPDGDAAALTVGRIDNATRDIDWLCWAECGLPIDDRFKFYGKRGSGWISASLLTTRARPALRPLGVLNEPVADVNGLIRSAGDRDV